MQIKGIPSQFGIENHGLHNLKTVYWNLFPPELVEQFVRRNEGELGGQGAVVVYTGQHTGRSPNDKFVVRHADGTDNDIWWGKTNQPISPEKFENVRQKMLAYLQGRDVFVQDLYAGAHPDFTIPIRIITEKAYAGLFANNLFLRQTADTMGNHVPEWVVMHCPEFQAVPEQDGTRSSTLVLVDFSQHLILIGGTSYAGEIKKSIFTVLNYVYPRKEILSMHCSANVGSRGDVALFFGLSGTGKTTLSSDPARRLIGDDEHGWSETGVFNFEGGCYAKTIHLKPELEPLIWEATRRFGTVLENVVLDPLTRIPDFDSSQLTENTRAAYPIDYVPNHVSEGYAGHPENIFFLTADAFGVLPPISRLTHAQAMYYFLSGYTSKIAGTEKGLGQEPQATFSTCFGSPFLPLKPGVYAELLGQLITRHHVQVWLINTGWTGGPFGVGSRIKLPYTRAMIHAVLDGDLKDVSFYQDDLFGLWIPETCPHVPSLLLHPEKTWSDPAAYRNLACDLVDRFEKNFAQFTGDVAPEVVAAGPDLD